jgi:hypothetical protein
MSSKVTFDPSQPLEVYFRKNRAWVTRRFVFKDQDENDFNVSGYTLEMFFKDTKESTDKRLSLTIANGGLTLSGTNSNIITPHADENQTNIRAREYYGEFYESSQKITWLNLKGICHNGEFDGVVETENVTVSLDGVDVVITVDLGGLQTLASLGTTLQTASADTPLDADTFNFYDAVDAILKKVTWANLKTTLASVFRQLTNSATALVDGSSIALTTLKHTLTTTQETITFTDAYTGDFIDLEVTFTQTSAVWTFPAGSLCVFNGTESGDNTMTVTGVSGDKIILSRLLINSVKYYIAKNFGQ